MEEKYLIKSRKKLKGYQGKCVYIQHPSINDWLLVYIHKTEINFLSYYILKKGSTNKQVIVSTKEPIYIKPIKNCVYSILKILYNNIFFKKGITL